MEGSLKKIWFEEQAKKAEGIIDTVLISGPVLSGHFGLAGMPKRNAARGQQIKKRNMNST